MIYKEFIERESRRQRETITLIASENYASKNVMEAVGSIFSNKYAEGYPGKRYYAGNQVVDEVEEWTKDLGLRVFGLKKDEWCVNVQPYSGSPANMAIYLALLSKGDKVMSLKLSHGGHLTHGHKVSFSGKLFDFVHYGVGDDGWFDYDEIAKQAKENKPKLIVTGATAYSRQIDFGKFRQMADEVGAYLLADISHIAGLIAAGLHPNCFDWVDVAMTTTHKTLRGPRGAVIFSRKKLAADIDKAVFPGLQGGPHVNSILGKGVAFEEALTEEFVEYQKKVIENAQFLSSELTDLGLEIVTGGTDNHLLLLDLSDKQYGAGKYQDVLEKIGIVVNKNTIPGEKRSPLDPSGIRLGTPAVTTRGMGRDEMKKIAFLINQAIGGVGQDGFDWGRLEKEVRILSSRFQVFFR
ncbi:serine hydroxymethyltransferase [Patescibacteria group bacterium]|nr:serine hydroxymethyltransferase [Patescibacteria group bacterium]